jgi:hypothetical protein
MIQLPLVCKLPPLVFVNIFSKTFKPATSNNLIFTFTPPVTAKRHPVSQVPRECNKSLSELE